MEEVGFSWGTAFERVSFRPSALKYTDIKKKLKYRNNTLDKEVSCAIIRVSLDVCVVFFFKAEVILSLQFTCPVPDELAASVCPAALDPESH